MRLQIALPPDVGEFLRVQADRDHRDVKRQIEKMLIDAARRHQDIDSHDAASEKEATNAR
jgi:hypothetical protein